MKRSKKTIYSFSFYVYLLNYLLIFSVLWLKYLDIYYTLSLIDDSQVSETNPIAQLVLNFDPIIVYLISLLPITVFFVLNFFIRKNVFFLVGLSIVLIALTIYLIPIVQNSLNILDQI